MKVHGSCIQSAPNSLIKQIQLQLASFRARPLGTHPKLKQFRGCFCLNSSNLHSRQPISMSSAPRDPQVGKLTKTAQVEATPQRPDLPRCAPSSRMAARPADLARGPRLGPSPLEPMSCVWIKPQSRWVLCQKNCSLPQILYGSLLISVVLYLFYRH